MPSEPMMFSVRIWQESRNRCGVADRTAASSPRANPPRTCASGRNRPTVVPITTYT
jgi:hypothetical protein